MKSARIILTLLAALFVLIYTAVESKASELESSTPQEQKVLESSLQFLHEFNYSDVDISVESKVKIYDANSNLIAFGNDKDSKIKRLIDISDLLIESGFTKLYRLSYE